MLEPLIPKPVASSLRYVVNIVQDGSHSKDGLSLNVDEYFADTRDLNLLRSVVFASMDFIKWLVMKLKERNDKSANEYNLWESVSEGTSEDCA